MDHDFNPFCHFYLLIGVFIHLHLMITDKVGFSLPSCCLFSMSYVFFSVPPYFHAFCCIFLVCHFCIFCILFCIFYYIFFSYYFTIYFLVFSLRIIINILMYSLVLIFFFKSLSRLRLFATPWTVAHQAPPSMGFSRQEYWRGLPFPSPGHLPHPGIKPRSPVLEADALTSEPPGKPSFD